MYSTIEDMGRWAAASLGTCLLSAELQAKRLSFHPIPEAKGGYGLGLEDFGSGWVGHTGQLIGWEALLLGNTRTGAAFAAIVNETGSLDAAKIVAFQALPDLVKLVAP